MELIAQLVNSKENTVVVYKAKFHDGYDVERTKVHTERCTREVEKCEFVNMMEDSHFILHFTDGGHVNVFIN